MKTVNNAISKLCTGFFAIALACTGISTANAEEVKVKDVKFARVPTANVDVVEEGCTLYVNLNTWRGVEECSVSVTEERSGEECLSMDLPVYRGQLEVPLTSLALGAYKVTITDGRSTLIISIDKLDETTDIYFDPFADLDLGL